MDMMHVIICKGITNEVAYVEIRDRRNHVKNNIPLAQAIDYATSLLKKS